MSPRAGSPVQAFVTPRFDGLFVQLSGGDYLVHPVPPPSAVPPHGGGVRTDGASLVEAPMPGRVVRVQADEGDAVEERQPLVIMEAMKIEHTVAAPRDGVVKRVRCQAGDQVERGTILVELEES